MRVVKCIRKSQNAHPALQVNKFYELVRVRRSGRSFYLVIRLEDGSEIGHNPEDFLIMDDDYFAKVKLCS